MRHPVFSAIAALALVVPLAAHAQAPSAKPTVFASTADVKAVIAKAKAALKPGDVMSIQRLLVLPPYSANIEYRVAAGGAAIHETEAEFFYVVDGSGVMETGGTVVDSKRSNPHNISGSALSGATAQKVSKGDFLVVPQGVPHRVSQVDGVLILESLHVPRGDAK
jgi:mannose-6-phosphate isomerase-like protein (cupin superfamily)